MCIFRGLLVTFARLKRIHSQASSLEDFKNLEKIVSETVLVPSLEINRRAILGSLLLLKQALEKASAQKMGTGFQSLHVGHPRVPAAFVTCIPEVRDVTLRVPHALLGQVLSNIDELFDRTEFSAAPDPGWPDCFNSGVFVFQPSLETHGLLLQHATDHGSFDGERRDAGGGWEGRGPFPAPIPLPHPHSPWIWEWH